MPVAPAARAHPGSVDNRVEGDARLVEHNLHSGEPGFGAARRVAARRLATELAVVAVLAIPIAWAIAAMGFTIAVRSPARDLVVLLLWSASEEIVFRGGLQTFLAWVLWRTTRPGGLWRRAWLGIGPANVLTSLVFCAVHLPQKPLQVALGLFPVSLLLGASLQRSGRLWVPVALHGYFNVLLYGASAWLTP